MKRLGVGIALSCLLFLTVALVAVGCGGSDGTGVLPTGRSIPTETVKIGVVAFDPSAEQFLSMKSYFDYLETKINIKFILL